MAKKAETVWLASDEDREGEAIAWHLKEVLDLAESDTRRIVFHEITKPAIENAVKNPRTIDNNLVNSQQARRVLDRIVGFEISPVLWRKVKPALSAGRVQSVAVRLIVEREREIDGFTPKATFKVTGLFKVKKNGKTESLKAEIQNGFESEEEATQFLEYCRNAEFSVEDLEVKPVKRSPAPPFTTSTLQQEASRKLRYSVSKTMLIAQRLYEAGKITYMRTDSVNLSDLALGASANVIKEKYGPEYSKTRKYKTKSSSAQEAHEAIRPTYPDKEKIEGSREDQALYELIWKRTIASQMADAKLERTTVKISVSGKKEKFVSQGEVVKFDGFFKVYRESTDNDENGKVDDRLLPPLKVGEKLEPELISATEKFSRPLPRYTEASLVKKLEELGIGRPSTYAPTISTIQRREYVQREEKPGREREYRIINSLNRGEPEKSVKTEVTGAEKGKLSPTDIGILVNDFLVQNFPRIMDYKFTAHIEKELDDIASGQLNWSEMLEIFYKPFHENVEETIEKSGKVAGERHLGKHPETGEDVYVRMARFGAVAQIGKPDDPEEKPKFAGLRPGQKLEKITLQEALDLFKLPRTVGTFEEKDMVAAIGRFGPYIRHDGKFYSLGKKYDPYTVNSEEAVLVIEEKRKKDAEKFIKSFEENPDFQILNGRWGPYLKAGDKNVRLAKDIDPQKLTYEDCVKLAEKAPEKKKKGRRK